MKRTIKSKSPNIDQIRLLIADDHVLILEGLAATIGRQEDMTVVATAIRKVHAGATCIPPALGAKLASRMSGEELTSREVDVLKLLARGRSNKEIGSDLFISENTVKTHVRSVFTKLNVMSRTEAIAAASHRGLIQL